MWDINSKMPAKVASSEIHLVLCDARFYLEKMCVLWVFYSKSILFQIIVNNITTYNQ